MSARMMAVQSDLTARRVHLCAPELIAAACSGDQFNVDLSQVTRIDLAGLQLLLMLKREAEQSRTPLSFVNPSAVVLRMADLHDLERALWPSPPSVIH